MHYELFKAPKGELAVYKKINLPLSDWQDGIVVRSPNWLGDIIMSLPAMYSLKKILPEHCGFFVITPDAFKSLFESIPWVNKVITVGDGHVKWTKVQIDTVRFLRPGIGFLFVNSLKSAYYLKKAGVKRLYGASNGIRDFLLTKNFKVNWHIKENYGLTHQIYKYLAMTYALGAPKWDNKFPDFQLLPDSIVTELESRKNILAIHPGAAYGPAKRWPSENFKKVCDYWIREKKGNVVILGLENERETAQEIINDLPEKSLINLVGKTNLVELMYVLKKADICLCNDSGTMHLAGALNSTGIAIFGSTDPYSTGPFGDKWIVMLEKQNCAPCFSRTCKNESQDYKCLYSISPEKVYKAIDQLFD